MPGLKASQPLKLVKIQVFQSDKGNKDTIYDRIIQAIKQKYGSTVKIDGTLEAFIDGTICNFKIERLSNFLVLTSTINYGHDYELRDVINNCLKFPDLSDFTSSFHSFDLLSSFTIFIPSTEDEHLIEPLVKQYSHHLSRSVIGIGVVRGYMMSIFESGKREEDIFDRYYFLSPFHLSGESAEERIEEILGNIKNLAIHTAELSTLYNRCKPFFLVLESGESEITEKTEDFMWKLIRPEPVELKTLESWLAYIMNRESTTSAMITNMQVNYTESKSIIFEVENLFKRLNERDFEDYPLNSDQEIRTYNKIIKTFENYIVRSEALKTRLSMIREEVRTYLSLQQQKIALDEQKASKEQLIRLVSLQEILHKLEILIVAFYLTEMARIAFESLIQESANLLTAAFIPIALVISIIISRILHKKH